MSPSLSLVPPVFLYVCLPWIQPWLSTVHVLLEKLEAVPILHPTLNLYKMVSVASQPPLYTFIFLSWLLFLVALTIATHFPASILLGVAKLHLSAVHHNAAGSHTCSQAAQQSSSTLQSFTQHTRSCQFLTAFKSQTVLACLPSCFMPPGPNHYCRYWHFCDLVMWDPIKWSTEASR